MTHREVPDSADREYLKGQNPAEGCEKGGLGAMKEAVYAFPDSSNEQRDILVSGLLVMSIRKHNRVPGVHGQDHVLSANGSSTCFKDDVRRAWESDHNVGGCWFQAQADCPVHRHKLCSQALVQWPRRLENREHERTGLSLSMS